MPEPEPPLLRLYPSPAEDVPLRGLYSSGPFGPPRERAKPFVYTNFIASLDGRISLPDPSTLERRVPPAIANARDWRLFQELAAGADALVVSGQYVRSLARGVSSRSFPVSTQSEHADLLRWRAERGLAPQPAVVVVTASLDLPPLTRLVSGGRRVYVAAGRAAAPRRAARAESQGARLLDVGRGARVEGARLVESLAREGLCNIAMLSGGQLLETLVVDDVLDRLYLTVACRLLGGLAFDTLLTGPVLEPARQLALRALHYDGARGGSGVEQLFAVFDRPRAMSVAPAAE